MYIASTMQQQPSTHGHLYICKQASTKDTSPKHPHFCPPFLLEEGLLVEPRHVCHTGVLKATMHVVSQTNPVGVNPFLM